MDEGSRRLPELVHLGGLFLRQDLRVQRERWRARKFTLLLVFPGLERVLKGLGHRTAVSHGAPLPREAGTCPTANTAGVLAGQQPERERHNSVSH